MRNNPVTFLLALVAFVSATALSGQPLRNADRSGMKSLESACDGVWLRIQSTVSNFSHMPANALDRAERTRVACLLEKIGRTTFDDDSQMNDVQMNAVVSTLVGVYGSDGYDFFASEFANQSARVQRALDAALFARGHPDAFRRYFETRRSNSAPNDSPGRSVAAAPAVWGPMIERGTCSSALCSTRIEETLEIVRKNLDIVDADLAMAESAAPLSSSTEATEAAAKTRSAARHLRETIGLIRRGDIVLGGTGK